MPNYKYNRTVIVEQTADEAAVVVADVLKSILCEAVAARETCHLALAGGTTPQQLYHRLAQEGIREEMPWSNVEVFFGDERDVPHYNADSNYGMVQRILLDHVPIQPRSIHPMPADTPDIAFAASQYEELIRKVVPPGPDGIPVFDLILLGMGSDGHVGSLFPGMDELKEREKLVIGAFAPARGRNRMSFTFPLINAARNIILMITGEDKSEIVRKLLAADGEVKDLPASMVNPRQGKLFVVLDMTAAAKTQYKL